MREGDTLPNLCLTCERNGTTCQVVSVATRCVEYFRKPAAPPTLKAPGPQLAIDALTAPPPKHVYNTQADWCLSCDHFAFKERSPACSTCGVTKPSNHRNR